MKSEHAVAAFEALASPIRLELYRWLIRHHPGGQVAGELAADLGLSASNLSFHLKTLSQAGLIYAIQEGRYQRYRADLARVQALIGFLTAECCGNPPERCIPLLPPPTTTPTVIDSPP